MSRAKDRGTIQFRVNIGVRSALHAHLAPLQPRERPATLLRLAEAGLQSPDDLALGELKRIADAIEGLAAAGTLAPGVRPGADAGQDVAGLERAFGE